jgi:hypothetical protein
MIVHACIIDNYYSLYVGRLQPTDWEMSMHNYYISSIITSMKKSM